MAKKDLTDLSKMRRQAGINEVTKKWSLVVMVYILVMVALFIDACLFLTKKLDKVEKRLEILTAIVLYLACGTHFISFIYNWDKLILLVKTIQIGERTLGVVKTANHVALRNEINEDMSRLNTVAYYVLFINGVAIVTSPFIITAYRVIQVGIKNVTGDIVYTVVPVYVPENHENFMYYFILLSMQSFFFFYSDEVGYAIITPVLNSMQMISGELKLLTLMVKEMDLIIDNNMNQFTSELTGPHIKDETECLLQLREMAMKLFVKCFVRQHCIVYKKVKEATRELQLVTFTQNIAFSIMLCASVYRLVKNNNIGAAQDAIFSSALMFFLYCNGMMGEIICTEADNLRGAVYECEWFDKPLWFRKSLLIIMTRANQEVEIKTFGVAVLGLKTFVRTVQATYSYYNVLNSF